MAESSSQERTEEATPRRRQDARKKGTVAKSQELVSALVLLSVALMGPTVVGKLGDGFKIGLARGLSLPVAEPSMGNLMHNVWSVAAPSLPGLALLLGCIMFVGVSVNLAQVGFVLSAESMKPNFAKLNPFNGVKRLFSFNASFEGMKAVIKSGLFGFILAMTVRAEYGNIIAYGGLTPAQALSHTAEIVRTIAIRLGTFWLVLAAADYLFQRQQVNKQLKMTKEEVRQEMKDQEQSAELRGAMARRRRKLARGRLRDVVASADAVITNPTHYAIAVKYELGKDHAPVVVAKGVDFLAARIREYATESNVPLVPNPPLARALYRKCEVGDFVPRELFQGVAEVLAYVYQTIRSQRQTR